MYFGIIGHITSESVHEFSYENSCANSNGANLIPNCIASSYLTEHKKLSSPKPSQFGNKDENSSNPFENKQLDEKIVPVSGLYQNWFLDYASYVILERAVPAIHDGLKPVQQFNISRLPVNIKNTRRFKNFRLFNKRNNK